jgi:glycerol-3-phosphate cytidylyltransferase
VPDRYTDWANANTDRPDVRKVLTIGTFDIMHPGHLELFRACRELAGANGQVIVAVNTDEFVSQFKPAPVMNEADRYLVVRALRDVNLALHNFDAGRTLWRAVHPHILAVGDDWLPRERYLKQINCSDEELAERDCELVFVPRTTGCSSTLLRQRLLARGA